MKPITAFANLDLSQCHYALFGMEFLHNVRALYVVSTTYRYQKILTKKWCKVWNHIPSEFPDYSIILLNKTSPLTIVPFLDRPRLTNTEGRR